MKQIKHNGNEKKLNFDLKKFKKFENKINYIILEDQPKNLHIIKQNDESEIKKIRLLIMDK